MRPSLLPQCLKQPHLLRWTPRFLQRTPRRIATTSSNNAAPIDVPKLVISPGSKHHDSLPSFLAYAKAKNLGPEKTVYIGTHYEYTTALALLRLGFSLLRIGRKNDAGIDLIGHWVLPPLQEPMPTIVQCKARKTPATPSQIRELEGSFQGIPPSWRKKDVLGLLVTTCKATKGTLEALGGSRFPLGFMLITRDGLIEQFVWNRAAVDRGLQGVGVTLRHTLRASMPDEEAQTAKSATTTKTKTPKKPTAKSSRTIKDIQLTWQGTPISPQRSNLSSDTLELLDGGTLKSTVADPAFESTKHKARTPPTRGRPRTLHKAPAPRGGPIGRKRVDIDSDEKDTETRGKAKKAAVDVPKKRGRPSGSKDKVIKRGRPLGSKNKPKAVAKDEV